MLFSNHILLAFVLMNTINALPLLSSIPSTITNLPSSIIKDVLISAPQVISGIWQKLDATTSSTPYTFTISLLNGNLDGLTTQMQQISNAGTGQWLTDAQLLTYTQPSAQTTSTVMNYLTKQGIPAANITTNNFGDQLTVVTTIGQTATLFNGQFYNYNVSGTIVPRTTSYTAPSTISSHVLDVSPLANFGEFVHNIAIHKDDAVTMHHSVDQVKRATKAVTSTSTVCNTSKVTPACLKSYYGTSNYTRSTGSTTKADVAVMGYIDQYVSQSDLTSFLKTYAPSASSYKIPIYIQDGATNNQSAPGIEAMLDVETVVSQIYPLNTIFHGKGNSKTSGDIFALTFNDFLSVTNGTRPKVISISYGTDENQMTSSQATAMCNAAQKLTALGTTIVVSSGDKGVSGNGNTKCPSFTPTYPSGCPYILSVGGTQSFSPEVMVNKSIAGFNSGAGASNLFSMPSYQTTVAAAYQKTISSQSGYYSQKGRMYPDLAAQASNYPIIVGGKSELVSGTSAATPLTASLLAMINDQRAKAGKGTIGWANPSIYSSTLNDVSSGGSFGCGSSNTMGFPASTGFDGASGNGTPFLSALNKAFKVSS